MRSQCIALLSSHASYSHQPGWVYLDVSCACLCCRLLLYHKWRLALQLHSFGAHFYSAWDSMAMFPSGIINVIAQSLEDSGMRVAALLVLLLSQMRGVTQGGNDLRKTFILDSSYNHH